MLKEDSQKRLRKYRTSKGTTYSEKHRQYYLKKRGLTKKTPKPENPTPCVSEYCIGCKYFGIAATDGCCDFMYETGQSRLCPAGDGCIMHTKFIKKTEEKKNVNS